MNPPNPQSPPPDAAFPGNWIWHPDLPNLNSYAEFETHFVLTNPTEAEEVSLYLSAETSYRLLVNGIRVCWGPAREVPPWCYVDTVPLRPYLCPGENTITLRAHHQGAASHTYAPGTPALFVGGVLPTESGPLDLSNAAAWRCRRLSSYRETANRLGACLGFAENHDLGRSPGDWVEAVQVAGADWSERPNLLPRDIPLFPYRKLQPMKSQPFGGGWLVDFGTEVFGFVQLTFTTDAPVSFEIHYAETLDRGVVNPRRHPAVDYRDTLHAPAGRFSWESYEKRAFRYLWIERPIRIESLSLYESNYPLRPLYRDQPAWAARETTEEGRKINRIVEVAARTIALNIDDIVTDCPWRERAQYFDIYFWLNTFLSLFHEDGIIRRFLLQYARGFGKAGSLRMCYPSPGNFTSIVDFCFGYTLLLEEYLTRSGDRTTVENLLPHAAAAVDAWRVFEQENLLFEPKGWVFLDNTAELSREPCSAALNALYSHALRTLAKLHRVFNQEARATEYETRAEAVKTAFRQTFLTADRLEDSTHSAALRALHYWNYHYDADRGFWTSHEQGKFVCFRTTFRARALGTIRLDVKTYKSAQVWIDGRHTLSIERGCEWNSPLIEAVNPVAFGQVGDEWHTLTVAFEFWGFDWEFMLSTASALEFTPGMVWELAEPPVASTPEPTSTGRARSAEIQRWTYPWMTQVTVGYAAACEMLTPEEARHFLKVCLPEHYDVTYRKRLTPYFSTVTDDVQRLRNRILPTYVPASAHYFCKALERYGLTEEMESYLRIIYDGMIERGATTFWEEWGDRSSLCHAWATFGVHYLSK